jgi:hypothetical protein
VRDPISKITNTHKKGAGKVAQVRMLPSKCEILSSNASNAKIKNKSKHLNLYKRGTKRSSSEI